MGRTTPIDHFHSSGSKWPETERVQNLRGPVGLSGHQQDKAGTLGMDGMVEPSSMWQKGKARRSY